MANRFPLIVDSSNQNIKELPDGDSLLLGDSEKLLLGDGTDLQLYHDGSNSYITNGTGILLQRADDIRLQNAAGSEVMLDATADGAVNLYHNGSAKIATASGGVSVTGEVAATSLDISGDIDVDGTANLDNTDIDGTLNTSGVVTSQTSANISQVAITSNSASVAWDAAAAANAYHVTTENTTIANPTNKVEGAIISVEIAQGGTARTIAWGGDFEFAASTAPTVTATANKTDIFAFRYNGAKWQEIGRVQNLAQS